MSPPIPAQSTLTFIEESIKNIMTNLPDFSHSEYMSLYTTVSEYCMSSDYPSSTLLSDRGTPKVSVVYDSLVRYLDIHTRTLFENMRHLRGEALVQYYACEWDNYVQGIHCLTRVFNYINHWLRRERTEGRAGNPLYIEALQKWKLNIFMPMQHKKARLTKDVLRMIKAHRFGKSIDQSPIKCVIKSFTSIGILNITNETGRQVQYDVYKEYFETPFLQETEAYYRMKSRVFLANYSVSYYIKKAVGWLKEEEDRLERYLCTQSQNALSTLCNEILICDHQVAIWELDFRQLIELDRHEDLQHMYLLLLRIPERLELLYKEFESFVQNAGLSSVSALIGEAHRNTKAVTMEPKAYVDTLIAVHNKNKEIVQKDFRGDTRLMACLDRASADYINRNAVTGNSDTKSAELLAKYADIVLRKRSRMQDGHNVEVALANVVVLVKYLRDNDVFQNLYHNRLAKRLVYGVSTSEADEMTMIDNLEVLYGMHYAAQLKRVMNDMKLSQEASNRWTQEMRQYCDTRINYSITVLAGNLWPLDPPTHEFMIPLELLPIYTGFQQYYEDKFREKRKLTWLWNYSQNELKTNYLDQSYMLLTSAYQTAILLQFNHMDTLSFDELFTAISIPKNYLKQILRILVKAEILINEEEDQYDLNPCFKSRKFRINLNQPIRLEQTVGEVEDVAKTVNHRKIVIEAMIVRVMKAHRQMKHQFLIQEVIKLLSHQFTPEVPDIKKAIGTLLEKEYIERVNNTKDTYVYIVE